eukprot:CAMPEP_0117668386 /NCGR_PEP_ID=MMETSP0804-20121206/11520_1 /TAXON_ID=1074897 /ORGANISM="Tetraselmis astigmatica, Strain CCMP880" /LENGTH=78 /DNA_ID=CAMNT_0005476271 /DNA_START=186 /DNA_END=422 /DNA_ORIENTATION=+
MNKQVFGIPQKEDHDKQIREMRQNNGSFSDGENTHVSRDVQATNSENRAPRSGKQVVGIPQMSDYDKQLHQQRSDHNQ